MNFIAYKVTNTKNAKLYIGVTRRSIKERWRDHLECAPSKQYKLYQAMRKYGVEAFSIEAVASARTDGDLRELEILLICQEDSFNAGYNATPGGDGAGKIITQEARERMRIAHLGKKPTADTLAKMSAAHKGRKFPPRSAETRAKISAAHKGRKGPVISPEGRARISEKNAGAGNGMFGRSHSEDAKRRIVQSIKDRADAYLKQMDGHLSAAIRAGVTRQKDLVEFFNASGITTRLGAKWNAVSVNYLLKRKGMLGSAWLEAGK